MADDPIEAGVHATRGRTRVYQDDGITVTWDPTLCIHTAICLRLLPEVFDVNARPWIDITGADADAIAATVRACPTSALRYDGPAVDAESPEEPSTVEIRPNGPLYVRGRMRISAPGAQPRELTRVALCRCGASENKPYCDNSHRAVGFRDTSKP
jgi:uncharacterized Fe-S cluster protein YjdI